MTSNTSKEFEGRVALVTGGSRGIGRACCRRLASAGARVAINYARNETAAKETARQVQEVGGEAYVVRADVFCEDQVLAMVDDVSQQLGPVDLLVNNAGTFQFITHQEITRKIWDDTINTNLTGVFTTTWAVKDSMVKREFGRIVNLSSTGALIGRPMSIPYSASKAALIGFTKSLAEALAGDNIRVNAVAPGLIATEILDGVEEQTLDEIIGITPLKRIGQPEEVADVVHFLLSEQSRFMTGQTLVISGGRVMRP